MPSGIAPTRRDNSASHVDGPLSFGVIYVNEAARRTLLEEKNPSFPVGSIIVREKLLQEEADAAPQLLVAMVKRERGFNPSANDWEFLVLDGSATRITERQKTGSCSDCHRRQENNDFVFRSYLPPAIRFGLKEKKL